MNKLFYFIIILLVACSEPKEDINSVSDNLEIRGADISFLPELRKSGITTRNTAGNIEDMLTTLKIEGMNVVRLRIWNNPSNEHSSMAEVNTFAKEIKSAGMKVWITVHYSDWWADPGKQNKPNAWKNLPFQVLKDSVYQFTAKIIKDINPEYIQIGNEINNGLLWPDGNISNLAQMKELLAIGVKAVRDQNPATKIMMHYAGHEEAFDFFNKIKDLDYDLMGLSYYPFWHGKNMDSLSTNLKILGDTFGKNIVIAETAYPFTFGFNDNTNNVIGLQEQIHPDFPPTVQGQRDFLFKVRDIIADAPIGIGFCYWAPEWVSFKGKTATNGSSWENQALWGFDNKALAGIKVFNP
jgi:arabinogalactan endo-1,4-beta-galactosidase